MAQGSGLAKSRPIELRGRGQGTREDLRRGLDSKQLVVDSVSE